MHGLENHLFVDLVTVVCAAFVGGFVARLIHVPPVLGYLAMGMLIGPYGMGRIDADWLDFATVAEEATVHTLAELGVVLLVFAIGIEVSFRELLSLGKVIVIGGLLQIFLCVLLITPVGVGLGFDLTTAIILGMVGALSSTMVVLKTLSDLGELNSLQGRIMTGFLLLQDLMFIPMIAMLPALDGTGGPASALQEVGWGILKATAVIAGIALLGMKIVPWAMGRITVMGSREMFVLMVVATAFAIAALTNQVGLSAALGAFVAGLLLSESDVGHWALGRNFPAARRVRRALLRLSGPAHRPGLRCRELCPGAHHCRLGAGHQVQRNRPDHTLSGLSAQHGAGDGTGPWSDRGVQLYPGCQRSCPRRSRQRLLLPDSGVSRSPTMARRPAGHCGRLKGGNQAEQPLPGAAPLPHWQPPRRRAAPAALRARRHLRAGAGGHDGGPSVCRSTKFPSWPSIWTTRTLTEWRLSGYQTVQGSADRVEVLRAARVPQAGLLVINHRRPGVGGIDRAARP